MEEIWKDIRGFEGRYQVSNIGRVRSLDKTWLTYNWKRQGLMECKRKGKLLKPLNRSDGYYGVWLRDGLKKECRSIHRIVAETFIPNPCNLPQINHRDENKSNNRVDNLEWCTAKYNSNYGTRKDRIREYNIKSVMTPIIQYDMNGNVINTFESLSEAERMSGISSVDIAGVCKGRRASTHGYVFKYRNLTNPSRKRTEYYNKPFLKHSESLKKKVCQYDLKGNLINIFDSIKEACRKTGISWFCIHGTLSGRRKHTYGYIFKFEGDEPPQSEVRIKRPIRQVLQYDLDGNILNTFDTIAEASRKTGICQWCIHGTLKGKRKKTHGFVFKFKENNL